jgi:hypothetical protein
MGVIMGRKPGLAEFRFNKIIKQLQPELFNLLYPAFNGIWGCRFYNLKI